LIDIHTHILPGIDDGAQSVEESLLILTAAVNAGVRAVVTTPHILDDPSKVDWKNMRDIFNLLNDVANQKGIDIRIIWGAEVFISPDLPEMINAYPELTINMGERHVLIELPSNEIPTYFNSIIFRLLVKGVVPIIAHPERNGVIQKEIGRVKELSSKGILCQINSGSLLGSYGRKAQKIAKRLLSMNLIDIIASDVHSLDRGQYPLMKMNPKMRNTSTMRHMMYGVPEKILKESGWESGMNYRVDVEPL
jgi:protein-tyrosine phosphatase